MEGIERVRVPGWYWAVAILALLWEAGGCYAYLMSVTMKPGTASQYSDAQQALFASTPSWVWAAYAIAVWVGLAGALALLMRSRWARVAFIVSLLAAIVQFGWVFLGAQALKTIGGSAAAVPVCVVLIGAFLIWFASAAMRWGWLR